MNSSEFDPQKLRETIERLRNGEFYPPRLQQTMAAIQRFTEQNEQKKMAAAAPGPAPASLAPTIRGETFGILAQAIERFSAEVHIDPTKGVHLNKVVRQWLKDRFGCSTREADVFGIILMEHFFPEIKIANKPERVPGKPSPAPSRRI